MFPKRCLAWLPRLAGWLVFAIVASAVHGKDFLHSGDPYNTERYVAPAPNLKWESSIALPEVKAPERARVPAGSPPLSLPELTELALRNNPKTRQAWAAARAAAAGVGIEQADDLPSEPGSGTSIVPREYLRRRAWSCRFRRDSDPRSA